MAVAALIGATAWFGHFAYLRFTLKPTPRPGYWQEQLASLRRPLPHALDPEEAATVLANLPWNDDPEFKAACPNGVGQICRGQWDESRPDIAAASRIFATPDFRDARSAIQRVASRGWKGTFAPNWRRRGSWAEWLVAHSRWARDHEHDPEEAIADWLATAQLNYAMLRHYGTVYWMFPTPAISRASYEMQYAASEPDGLIDVAELMRELDSGLLNEPPAAGIAAAFRSELHRRLEEVYVREGGDWLCVNEMVARSPWGMTGKPSRWWNLTSPLFHDLATAREAVERYISTVEGVSDMAACIRLARSERAELADSIPTVLDGFYRHQLSEFTSAASLIDQAYIALCELDAGLTMLALSHYRHVHGHYPDRLEELLPQCLPRLPVDYGDGGVLRYERLGDGYLLYSVGPDGSDDGGTTSNVLAEWQAAGLGIDVVFSLRRRPEPTE